MSALTNVQFIEQNGKPAFAVISYEEYLKLLPSEGVTIPHEVVGLVGAKINPGHIAGVGVILGHAAGPHGGGGLGLGIAPVKTVSIVFPGDMDRVAAGNHAAVLQQGQSVDSRL